MQLSANNVVSKFVQKLVAYRLRSLAGKPHLSDNLEQPHLPPHPHRTQAEQLIYSVLRLRSQVTKPMPMVLSRIAEGAGMVSHITPWLLCEQKLETLATCLT